ncbi:MAG: glycosyltransferase family 4 protein [Dehalococcoidia bacterium]|nr:glycosyltransferase family 4 protein [Dehalococcoidia bacterium]
MALLPHEESKTKRVLFVTRKWPPAVGGMETYSVELVNELAHLCDLTVRKLHGRRDGRPPSFVALLHFTLLSTIAIAMGKRFDVIHVGDLVLWPLSVIAHIFQRSARVVIASHGTDIGFTRCKGTVPFIYRRYLALAVRVCPRKLRVIANSHYTAVCCRAVGFRDVVVIAPGVSAPAAVEGASEAVEPYVLYVGRLARRKGAGWFAQYVLPLLASEIKLLVVGPPWDDSEWRAVSGNSRVEYRGAVTCREELRQLRRKALAVIVPNVPTGLDFEGFGLTALEAAADGGVLLASGIEGIVDAVVDGETGFLLPALDARAWASKVSEISQWSLNERTSFVRQSRRVIRTRYSWSRVACETLEYYRVPGREL